MKFTGADYAFVFITLFLVIFGGIVAFLFGHFLPSEFTHEAEGEEGGEESQTAEERMKSFQQIDIETEVEKGNPSSSEKIPPKHKWLVSVSRYRYKDLPSSLEFFCSGVIVAKTKMLTGDGCNREHFKKQDLHEAVVRSNSLYFWKGGKTHKITKLIENIHLKTPYNQIYILEVTPEFAVPSPLTLLAALTIARKDLKHSKFDASGWGGQWDQTEQIFKNKPYVKRTFGSESVLSCENKCHEIPDSPTCCVEAFITNTPNTIQGPVSGRFLIEADKGQILAAELVHTLKSSDEKDRSYFIDLGEPDFIKWIKMEIPEMVKDYNVMGEENPKKMLVNQIRITKDYITDVKYVQHYNPLIKYVPSDDDVLR